MTTAGKRPLRVLILCTGNSARSQIAEAVLNQKGRAQFIAESAGSSPAPRVNPYAVEALREAGATKVYACATHALFNGPALERIADSAFERVIVTDTVPQDEVNRPANVEVLSISGLLAQTIMNVFADDSVSAIFAGENQLF